MRKLLLTAIALALAAPALAAQQDIAQISAVTASREALRTAINTQLSAVQANFDEIYAVIDAGPVYVNASAPADTKVVWIDTDQSNAIKVYVGGVWTVVGSGGEGSYTLPTAAADTLGGVKVGARLTITDGVLSADVQTTDISGKENSLGNPSTSGYVLSSTTSGVRSWIEMTGGGTGIAHATSDGTYYASKDGSWATLAGVFQPADADLTTAAGGEVAGNSKLFGTNASGVVGWYDIPGAGTGIAHATADGKWYGSKDGAWVDLAPTFSSAMPRWIDLATGHSFSVGDLTWYNATVWEAKTNHVKAAGNYPVALSSDWQPYAAEITLDASLTETGGVLSVTNPVTTEVYGADWSTDTEGTMRKDIYAILHAGDTDDDGKADLLDAAVVIPDSGTLTFDESAADPNDADVQLSAADGVFKFAAVNGANNEDLTIDLDGTANTATLSSSTGLTMITTGSIPFTSAVKTTAIDTDTTLSGSAEYGSLTFNTAASTRTLTVTAGAGKSGCFRNAQGVAQILRIDAADGDYIVKPTGARTSAAGEYYGATADAKNQVCWISRDNDDIYITSEVGTWTEQE